VFSATDREDKKKMEISLLQFGLLVGVVSGFLVGLIPVIPGFAKGDRKFGILGFLLSLIAGAFFSLLGALPAAGIFIWLILRKKKESPAGEENAESGV
jgi:hypothetical protein